MSNGAKKKSLISQRWEEGFQKSVRKTASKFGQSMTQLTIEALDVYINLSDSDILVNLEPFKRKNLIQKAVRAYLETEQNKNLGTKQIVTSGLDSIGLIRDRIESLLRQNPDYKFTTTEISGILNIPQSTARTYVRIMYEENPEEFILVKGRPNKIFYDSIH